MRSKVGVIWLLIASALGGVANAQAERILLHIEAQPIRQALKDLGQQTGLSIVFRENESSFGQLQAPSVTGELSPREALERLLANTGLQFQFVNPNTVLVSARPAAAAEPTVDRGLPLLAQTDAAVSTSSTPQSSETALDEIIVTAQKREERLQDVPISITVLDGDRLDRASVNGLREALNTVAGVSLITNQNESPQLSVRGVAAAATRLSGSGVVGYYLDTVPFALISSALIPDSNVYDLERVEVLRGPQGTLYGASSLNGVMRILTKDADLNEFQFKAREITSSTEDGDWSYRGDMAVNVPIVANKLAVRLVAGYQDLGGWIDRPQREDANSGKQRNLRAKINAQPTDALSMSFTAWRSRISRDETSVVAEGDDNPVPIDEPNSDDYDAQGLKIGYKLPWFSITSMTSHIKAVATSNLAIANFFVDPPSATPVYTNLEGNVFAQEVLLTSTPGGRGRWAIGGIYRNAKDQLFQSFPTLGVTLSDRGETSESYALYGEVTRAFLDGKLELTGGLRYFEDKIGVVDRSLGLKPSDVFSKASPRAVLTWLPNANLNVYASYAEGFRSGVQQQTTVIPLGVPPADPDTLRNYELGSKGSLLDGRLSFDASLYYIDWRKLQQPLFVEVVVSGIPAATQAVVNGDSASGLGFDLALTARPVEHMTVGATFSWNDLTFDSDVISGSFLFAAKGDRLNFSPDTTWGVYGKYGVPLTRSGFVGEFAVSANYTAEQLGRSNNGFVASSDPILMTRASFTLQAPKNWSAMLFVDNATNEDGNLGPTIGPVTADGLLFWNARLRPRTIGLQLDYRFD